MALPVTLSGVSYSSTLNSGHLGPYLYGTAVYVAVRDSSGYPTVHKATDPTSSFSEQDSSNNPTVAAAAYMSAHFDGTYIHVMWVVSSTIVTHYARFNCSTDSWVDASNYGGTGSTYYRTIYTPTIAPVTNPYWGSITVRSDGDVIIFHPGENANIKAGDDQSAAYSRIEGTSLTAGTVVEAAVNKNGEFCYGYVVMGSSDQCHFGYFGTDAADFFLKALDSSNNLRTQRTSTGTYTGVSGGTNFTRSSTETIAFQVHNGGTQYRISFPHFTDDSSPTFTVQTITSSADSTYDHNTCTLIDDADAANQDNYAAYIASADGDIYLMGDDGGGTWSDQNSSTAIRVAIVATSHISANIFDRGGNMVYAFLYVDGTNVKYDEFQLYVTIITDALGTPPDISSSSFVGNPAITQLHNITTAGVSSQGTLGAVTLTQDHDLTTSDISSQGTLDTPIANLIYTFSVTEISSVDFVDTPAITQLHTLTTAGVSSVDFVDTPAITQNHDLTTSDISSQGTLDNPTANLVYTFSATEITSDSFVDNPTLGTIYAFVPLDLSSASFIDIPVVDIDYLIRVKWTGGTHTTYCTASVTSSQLKITK